MVSPRDFARLLCNSPSEARGSNRDLGQRTEWCLFVRSCVSTGGRSKYAMYSPPDKGYGFEYERRPIRAKLEIQPLLPLSWYWSHSLPRPILAICSGIEWLLGRVWVTSLSEESSSKYSWFLWPCGVRNVVFSRLLTPVGVFQPFNFSWHKGNHEWIALKLLQRRSTDHSNKVNKYCL